MIQTPANKTRINHALEALRIAGAVVAFVLASTASNDPRGQLSILALVLVVVIAGLTGIESLFFGEGAAALSGYTDRGAYQRQSGLNNVALALAAPLCWVAGLGFPAQLALLLALVLFLALSALNHLYSALREGNLDLRSFTRPVLVVLLIAAISPYLAAALRAAP